MKENKILNVAIIGVGARGGYAYGTYMLEHKEKFQIIALCDPNLIRLNKWGDIMGVPTNNRFSSEEEFFKEKRADAILVSTMDQLHVRQANKALDLGYNVLLEKPISDDAEELRSLVEHAKKAKRTVMVCHVLRYTVWIKKCKELIDNGEIGELVSIDSTENVVYWHEAHSFVRGNWRKREECVPMIMAKCCHDLDLLQYFAGSKCKCVSSMGDLRYFKRENQPKGATERCTKCKYVDTCVYSAKSIYIKMWHSWGEPQTFPFTLITDVYPVTEKALWEAIENGRYGRCVFACDNDVVDNQTTIMTFDNNITATLKMEAFCKDGGRDMTFFGTLGELQLRESADSIILKKFDDSTKIYKLSELTDDLVGHGGGDHRMLDKVYDVMALGDKNIDTSIESSVESHYMALAAEESRLNDGKLIYIDKYRKEVKTKDKK